MARVAAHHHTHVFQDPSCHQNSDLVIVLFEHEDQLTRGLRVRRKVPHVRLDILLRQRVWNASHWAATRSRTLVRVSGRCDQTGGGVGVAVPRGEVGGGTGLSVERCPEQIDGGVRDEVVVVPRRGEGGGEAGLLSVDRRPGRIDGGVRDAAAVVVVPGREEEGGGAGLLRVDRRHGQIDGVVPGRGEDGGGARMRLVCPRLVLVLAGDGVRQRWPGCPRLRVEVAGYGDGGDQAPQIAARHVADARDADARGALVHDVVAIATLRLELGRRGQQLQRRGLRQRQSPRGRRGVVMTLRWVVVVGVAAALPWIHGGGRVEAPRLVALAWISLRRLKHEGRCGRGVAAVVALI